MNPVSGKVTSSFGKRMNPILNKEEFHNGIDIAAATGTPALAVGGGRITYTGTSSSYGINLKMTTDDGFEVMYAHLSALLTKEGDIVRKGQAIAETGNTGLSTGPHLHLSVWKDADLLDPFSLFNLELTQDAKDEYILRGEPLPE